MTILRLLAAACLSLPAASGAVELRVPLALDYDYVRQALLDQVFIGPDDTATVLDDGQQCNVLVLSAPQVAAAGARVRLRIAVEARGGTPLGGRCVQLFSWGGQVEILEDAFVHGDRPALGFRIADSNFIGPDGAKRVAPGLLWDWLKKYAHPRLEAFAIDFQPALFDAGEVLRAAAGGDPAIDAVLASLRPREVVVGEQALAVGLTVDVPAPPADWSPPPPAPPLTVDELRAWDEAWQTFDTFLAIAVKQFARDGGTGAVREALLDVLLDARYGLREALAADEPGPDPVRALFRRAWERLAPVARNIGDGAPGATAVRYLGLITAADALLAIDQAGPHLGLRVDREGLRRLARIVVPDLQDAAFEYSTAIDPELRELLGFGAPLEATAPDPGAFLDWLVAPATAAQQPSPELVRRLRERVPGRDDLDEYLGLVGELLGQTTEIGLAGGRIPEQFEPVYRRLVLTTAWQETCWRQYERAGGAVRPLRSSAGSVGLMQINEHVWRGFYELELLRGDVGYNARAGNEILIHYLVDYAIRKREHEHEGGADNLARATYAVYNGGPRHLSRYRDPATRASLRAIDAAFWDKYRKMAGGDAKRVRECYGS